MNPLFFVAAAALLSGSRRRNRRKAAEQPQVRASRSRGKGSSAPKVTPRRQGGNGRVKQNWTSFPWQPERVTEVAAELLEKGVTDSGNLTLAVAKTVYPVHPITGQAFEWPADAKDVGATMIWQRIRLRVSTLIAADEERQADEATVHASEATAASTHESEDSEQSEDDENDETEDDEASEDDASSPLIGRMAAMREHTPSAVAPALVPGGRSLTLRRRMRRRVERKFDPGAYLPEDNRLMGGVLHTVLDRETIQDIAVGVLVAYGQEQPNREQVAQYISLIICSPYNVGLATNWNEDFDLPGAPPYPWGAERPELWLPKLNEEKLASQGLVTTHGVTWSDGSSGITPPPDLLHWRGGLA